METEIDKLRRDLRRYRYLLSRTTDAGATKALMDLIAEAEARLHAIEQGGAAA